MKSRHLIFIILVGTGLIVIAPTAEKAGQAAQSEIATEPADTEQRHEPERAEIRHASFDGKTEKLNDTNN